jgi:hypothetical protein
MHKSGYFIKISKSRKVIKIEKNLLKIVLENWMVIIDYKIKKINEKEIKSKKEQAEIRYN